MLYTKTINQKKEGKKMKVYVITKGEYSDYMICDVTLDKEQAELLKIDYSDRWEEAQIEEYDTERYKIEVSEDYKPMWKVEFCRNEMRRCYAFTGENVKHGTVYNAWCCGTTYVYVNAKDEEHAKKIAKDIYMKWLAKQNDL